MFAIVIHHIDNDDVKVVSGYHTPDAAASAIRDLLEERGLEILENELDDAVPYCIAVDGPGSQVEFRVWPEYNRESSAARLDEAYEQFYDE